jgi:ribosomal protein S18 acetylase RimI-like enzyme
MLTHTVVRLVPMESGDYAPMMDDLIRAYAEDHVRAGRWTESESLAKSREELEELLPAGVATPNHFFFTILAGDPEQKVGVLWLSVEPGHAFIFDLLIYERFRRKGYAKQAMLLLEDVAREKGAASIGLHVFADNRGARDLYVQLGYRETGISMSKSLAK